MEKFEGTSLDLKKLNTEKIKELFPNCVTEGKINFDILRADLGDEVDDLKEKYQFTWNGKNKAIKIAQSPSSATLRPCKDKSKDWDKTENLYIEGDNLEVLKQLQKTYYGKIKLIYIDPPYNTGNDFVYKDDFKNTIENYKELTSQQSTSNPETSGRYHTDWLNMIFPRLILAKNLLKQDGVIFISIDDNEQSNLKKICDEVFGETNFLAQIVWERSFSPINLKKHFSESHDYILCYAKNIEQVNCNGLPRSQDANDRYSNPDNDPRGPWTSGDLSVGPRIESKVYEIITPKGKTIIPPSGYCWRLDKETFEQYVKENKIWFGDGTTVPRIKRFLKDVKQGMTPMTVWKYTEVGHSQDATKQLKDLFDGKSYFDYPKPTNLIKRCLQLYSNKDSIILDFFSGSSTTAESVMQINSEDEGNRKFIMIQLPEQCSKNGEAYKAGYATIPDIAEERIRRAGERIKRNWLEKNCGEGLFKEDKEFPYDIGFKVFKLDSTNINSWDNEKQLIDNDLFSLRDIFKADRSKEDILYEIMLKYGVFDMPVSEIDINGKTMYKVGGRYMIVCLEDNIDENDVKAIGELEPKVVIFKESGFMDDNAKINAEKNLERYKVEDIKCI